MKKFFVIMVAAILLVFGAAAGARATVLTFDDISAPSTGTNIPTGYGGLNWNNMYVLNAATYMGGGTGYDNGRVSGTNIAYSGSGTSATVSSVSSFDFNGAYLTGAWNNGLSIDVQGYLGATILYSQTVVVDTLAPTWFGFNYLGIDKLIFDSFGGVDAGYGGGGTHFAMDNFTFDEPVMADNFTFDDPGIAPVPEPSTMILLGAGLMGLVAFRKKFKRS